MDGDVKFQLVEPRTVRIARPLFQRVVWLIERAPRKLTEVILSGRNREVILEDKKASLGTFTEDFGYVTATCSHSETEDDDELLISIEGQKPYARIHLDTGYAEVDQAVVVKGDTPQIEEVLKSI